MLICCDVDLAISLSRKLLVEKPRRENKSVYLLKGKHVFVDSTFIKWLSLLLQCELLAQVSALSLYPNAIWKRRRREAGQKKSLSVRPFSHTPSPSLSRSEREMLCWEVPGAPWLSYKSHSVREEDLYSQLGNNACSTHTHTHTHTRTYTHTHSHPAKTSSFARTETEDKVQSQEQLNCFHDFPAAFWRQIGGLCFKCIPNLHFDWLTGHANSTVKYWSVKGIWQFSTIAEMALKQTCESWGEKKK